MEFYFCWSVWVHSFTDSDLSDWQHCTLENTTFVRNLILNNSCEFYYDDVTVMLFVNDKYGDATAESIP